MKLKTRITYVIEHIDVHYETFSNPTEKIHVFPQGYTKIRYHYEGIIVQGVIYEALQY